MRKSYAIFDSEHCCQGRNAQSHSSLGGAIRNKSRAARTCPSSFALEFINRTCRDTRQRHGGFAGLARRFSCKWGAVEVHGVGDGRKIYCTVPPREKTIRCRAAQPAKDYVKNAVARRRSHSYELLAGNITIWRRPANRGDELQQALATILFVDIVRSTEKVARLGDSRWIQ